MNSSHSLPQQRAGFYSIDLLDNAGVPSAREIVRDLVESAGAAIAAALKVS